MNTLICVVILGIVAFTNYSLCKSLLYPPVIFACYWGALLLLLFLSPINFFQLSNKTLSIFILGAVFFSLGSLTARQFGKNYYPRHYMHQTIFIPDKFKSYHHSSTKVILTFGLILWAIMLPFYLYYLRSLLPPEAASTNPLYAIGLFARELRVSIHTNGMGLFKYLIAWGSFFALISMVEYQKGRSGPLLPAVYILLALIYNFLSTARTGLIFFILSILIVYFISKRRIKISTVCLAAAIVLIAFFLPAIFLQKGINLNAGISHNLSSMATNIQVYLVGSLVAFDKAIHSPVMDVYFSSLYSLRFFFSILHFLGINLQSPPELVLPYFYTPYPVNIYTMYFPWYIDFSWLGIFAMAFCLGLLATFSFTSALNKKSYGMLFYATIMSGILLGNLGDFFLVGLSFWLQLIVVSFIVYKIPGIIKSYFNVKERYVRNA
jgi:oligosaccharide repeat unit polymerase